MEINYNPISLLDFFGTLQGVTLGILLLMLNFKKKNNMFFLVLFLVAYSIEFIPIMIRDFKLTTYHPRLVLLPLHTDWVLYALFYIYIRKISILQKSRINYWPIYPGIAYFIFSFVLFAFLPNSKIDNYMNSTHFGIIGLGLCLNLYILWLTDKYITWHIQEVNKQYSSVEEKELRWAKKFVRLSYIMVAIKILLIIYRVYVDFSEAIIFHISRVAFSCLYVFIVYWLSYRVIAQQNVQSIISGLPDQDDKDKTEQESAPKLDDLKQLAKEIDGYLHESKSYTKPSLTLLDISQALEIHHRNISTAINKIKNKNFSAYINKFRVEMAKDLLGKDSYTAMSIDGIGMESGFQSKSAFYTWFKRFNGITPYEYRLSMIEKKTNFTHKMWN